MVEPRYFIGIGGTGIGIANKIYQKLIDFYGKDSDQVNFLYPVFGLDGETWLSQMKTRKQYCWTGKFSPASYINDLKKDGVDADWFPIPLANCQDFIGSSGLGQRRPQGKLALLYHLNRPMFDATDPKIGDAVYSAHTRAMNVKVADAAASAAPVVFLACSLCGATGAGIMLPLAVYLRAHLHAKGIRDVRMIGIALLPETQKGKSSSHARFFEGNAYGSLWETAFWSRPDMSQGRRYYDRFDIRDPSPMRLERDVLRPFNLLYLMDGVSTRGKYLDHYSEYEQLAADIIFDMEYTGINRVLVNVASGLMDRAHREPLGSGGKSILRYPVLKHQERLARLVIEDFLRDNDGRTNKDIRETGARLGLELWNDVREFLLAQDYARPITRGGAVREIMAPGKIAESLSQAIESTESDNFRAIRDKIVNEWQRYRTQVEDFINANAQPEFEQDWEHLSRRIHSTIKGEHSIPWGAVDAMINELCKHIEDTMKSHQQRMHRTQRVREGVERQLEQDLESYIKSYSVFVHYPMRKRMRSKLVDTVRTLFTSFWEERTLNADIRHLANVVARLRATYVASCNALRTALDSSQFPDLESDDIYVKTEVVKEVWADSHVAEEAYKALQKDDASGASPELDELKIKLRNTVGDFLVTKILTTIESRVELKHKLIEAWGSQLRDDLARALYGSFRRYVDIDIWEALSREGRTAGYLDDRLVGYITDLLHSTSHLAAAFVHIQDTAEVDVYSYLQYNEPAWRKFYEGSITSGQQEIQSLEDCMFGGDVAVKKSDDPNASRSVIDPRHPGNPYEIVFFSSIAGFASEDIMTYETWKASARWAESRGREIFLHRGISDLATSSDLSNFARFLFLIAEHLGVITQSGSVFKFRNNSVATGLRGRKNAIEWFVLEGGEIRNQILEDLNVSWQKIPAADRAETIGQAKTSIENRIKDPRTNADLKTIYRTDEEILKWALEQKAYDSESFQF